MGQRHFDVQIRAAARLAPRQTSPRWKPGEGKTITGVLAATESP